MKKIITSNNVKLLLLILLTPIPLNAFAGDIPDFMTKALNEFNVVDSNLNTTYKTIIKKIDSDFYAQSLVTKNELKHSLITSQRSWIKYRDDTCDAYFTLYSGGTSREWDKIQCNISITNQRIEFLKHVYIDNVVLGEKTQ